MKIDKYWKLRLKKWWFAKIVHYAYKDLPFEIAYTDISERYEPSFEFGEVLAAFDVQRIKRHYVIYIKKICN